MTDNSALAMEIIPERDMSMRWESQETIATSRAATPSEPEAKSIICGSQEFIIATLCSPFPDEDEKDSVRESTEDIVRNGDAPFDPDALDLDLEKLGRQRPECLPTAFREFAFVTSILSTMVMAEYFIAGAHIILPSLAESLQIPKASQTWVSSVLTLAAGASLLPLGRLADMHGGYLVFNAGLLWFSAWSLVAGFMPTPVPFIVCRAMQGLGASAFLPTGIMLMGKIYRPGPRKNFVFGMYGAIAPAGFFFGMAMGGIAVEKLSWRAFFWMGSALGFTAVGLSLVAIPRDWKASRAAGVRMDWWGLGTVCPGLIFVVFAITQSSAAPRGWATPYIIVMMVLGVLFLAAGGYVQARVSADPFIPAEIFRPKYMKEMLIGLFLAYGCFGIFLYYSNFYIELVLHVSPLNTAFWYSPWAIAGLILAAVSGVILHLVPGRILLLISAASSLGSALFFALMPEKPNYWAHVLPSMVLQTAFVDVIYTTSNVFITTRLPARHQGLAGALINATLYVGICTFLGIADVAVAASRHLGLAGSYKVAFWIVVGVSAAVMVLFAFVDIGSAKSELTADEKRERSRMEAGTSMETLTRAE